MIRAHIPFDEWCREKIAESREQTRVESIIERINRYAQAFGRSREASR